MQVSLDPNAAASGQDLQAQAPKPANARTEPSGPVNSQPETEVPDQKASPSPAFPEADVTFKRDSDGRIYYVVTDATSGKELREVPSEEVRKAGEGIEQFLKEKQAAASEHLEVKG